MSEWSDFMAGEQRAALCECRTCATLHPSDRPCPVCGPPRTYEPEEPERRRSNIDETADRAAELTARGQGIVDAVEAYVAARDEGASPYPPPVEEPWAAQDEARHTTERSRRMSLSPSVAGPDPESPHYDVGGITVAEIVAAKAPDHWPPAAAHSWCSAVEYLLRAPWKDKDPRRDLEKVLVRVEMALEELAEDERHR